MSYFPNVFPTVCYSDRYPRGKQFDSPAEFARADDGKWVDTPALLPFEEHEKAEALLKEIFGGPNSDQSEIGPPDVKALDSMTKAELISAFNLPVKDVRTVTKQQLIDMIARTE